MSINNRIEQLRTLMKEQSIDAYIIPSTDAHQSEYVPEFYKGREWISGFTGSAGTVVITRDHAGLWTDSRYFIQADRELSESEIVLHKLGTSFSTTHVAWLADNLSEGNVVGFDPKTITVHELSGLQRHLPKGTSFYDKRDLLAEIWDNRTPLPTEDVEEFSVSMAGVSRHEKLTKLKDFMHKHKAQYMIVPTLDDIAWIFNIRGNDVAFNPVVVAYAIIGTAESHLFIDESKLNPLLSDRLLSDDIHIRGYGEIGQFLADISVDDVVLLDSKITSVYLDSRIRAQKKYIPLPARSMKAIKNKTEIDHVKNAMIKDGIALTKAFMWLESTLEERTVSEYEFSNKLAECRASQENYKGESFNAIVGYKGNGAIVHYSPKAAGSAEIKKNGVLLCDSGGHYLDGTTDITRTIALSTPSVDVQKDYTLVLKGHISLATCIFPKGTRGIQLDAITRQHLWQQGNNYGHGTGHGVGFFLNVHEPPQGFSATLDERGSTVLKPGMLSSNEPGHYVEGQYGIRIENLIVCRESDEHDGFLRHHTLTLFPIDTDLIYTDWLTEKEVKWLNAYHRKVRRLLSPHLNEEEKIWLEAKCKAIDFFPLEPK